MMISQIERLNEEMEWWLMMKIVMMVMKTLVMDAVILDHLSLDINVLVGLIQHQVPDKNDQMERLLILII